MNVELPNGVVIEGVPEGTTKDQIMQKAISSGLATAEDFGVTTQDEPQEAMPEQSLDESVLSKPGMKVLSELAAATNKSIFEFIDFLGPNNVNAISQLAGSDYRMPTVSETLGSDGGYMDEGLARDTVQAIGNTVPSAVLAGQAMRTGAAALPKLAVGESAGKGVIRQLGQSTAKQDLTTGALAAAGSEVGEELGGDTGRLAGGLLAPSLAAAPSTIKSAISGPSARKLLQEAAPTSQQLKESAREVYKQLDDAGVVYSAKRLVPFTRQVADVVQREGFNAKIHPKVSAALDELAKTADKDLTLTELDTLRKVARAAARSIDPDEGRLGGMIVDRIDDFMANTKTNATEGATEEVRKLFSTARGLWGKARRTELIDEAIEKAGNQASGFENGLRTQFRSILNNKKKMQGFSDAEKEAIKTVVRGGKLENTAKALGKFGFSEGQATSMLLSSLGAAGGAAIAGPGGAAAVPLAGQAFKSIAQKLTRDNATLAKRLVSAGASGEKIARAYMAATPKQNRSVEELTALLIAGKAPVASLKKSSRRLVADAAYAASVLSAVKPADTANNDELEN